MRYLSAKTIVEMQMTFSSQFPGLIYKKNIFFKFRRQANIFEEKPFGLC